MAAKETHTAEEILQLKAVRDEMERLIRLASVTTNTMAVQPMLSTLISVSDLQRVAAASGVADTLFTDALRTLQAITHPHALHTSTEALLTQYITIDTSRLLLKALTSVTGTDLEKRYFSLMPSMRPSPALDPLTREPGLFKDQEEYERVHSFIEQQIRSGAVKRSKPDLED